MRSDETDPAPSEGGVTHVHSLGFLRVVDEARSRVDETDIPAVCARIQRGERFHLVDVREQNEWAEGHIPGATYLGRGVLERDIEGLIPDANEEIVLYCGGGYRSVLAADSLQRMGYTKVSSMDGGMRVWRAEGLPEERG